MTPATLPAIPWTPMPITPLPDVHADNSDFIWYLWDAAVRSLDQQLENAQ